MLCCHRIITQLARSLAYVASQAASSRRCGGSDHLPHEIVDGRTRTEGRREGLTAVHPMPTT